MQMATLRSADKKKYPKTQSLSLTRYLFCKTKSTYANPLDLLFPGECIFIFDRNVGHSSFSFSLIPSEAQPTTKEEKFGAR
jgi:hypothetical protein